MVNDMITYMIRKGINLVGCNCNLAKNSLRNCICNWNSWFVQWGTEAHAKIISRQLFIVIVFVT